MDPILMTSFEETNSFPLFPGADPPPPLQADLPNPKPPDLLTSEALDPADLPAPEFGLGQASSSVLSYLIPPNKLLGGNNKLKRGPGRPRKDCLTPTSLHPGKNRSSSSSLHKMKGLLGGVSRGRKKSELPTSLIPYSVNPLGPEMLIGESPPRGADDTAESDSSSVASSLEKMQDDFSMFAELWPGKVCGFCNLGERSMLGQGELLRLEVPEGFDPPSALKTLTPKSRIEKDNCVDKNQKPGLFSRRQKGSGKMKRLISQSSLESMNEPVDEICGHQDEPEWQSVFDTTSGFYFVHASCALWCDGVERREDGTFINLETEILRAFSQRCQHCGNFGAGLMCNAEGCGVLLHYSCAAVSGAFQDPSNHSTVCSAHVQAMFSAGKISGICTVCDSRTDIMSLIMCSSCGGHYHGPCMALNSDLCIRAGWQCPACKICQACRQPGDETRLLACDTCDKTYHIFCLRPQLSSIPKHSWKCKMCRMCTDCGARTPGSGPSSRWHANFSVCDSCYQQRNKGLACPLCGRAYRHVAQKLMLQCSLCKKYVHGTCDPAADLATYQQRKELYPDYEYICAPCKASGTGLNTLGGNPKVLSSLKRSDDLEDNNGMLNLCATSQDSILSMEDDSYSGMESSSDLVWLDKSLSSTSLIEDSNKPQLPLTLFAKDKNFFGSDRFQKQRKFVTGRLKVGEKGLGPGNSQSLGRKSKFNEFAKKRGPKPKLRLFDNGRDVGNRNSDGFSKEDEPGVENRMVLCSARDDFVLQQDLCVMCGALGNELEGRLISCSQCGQCYHPYCVNVKVTKVILTKGWRCLDCTVCEGCGQRNDEARLILCDECDVSFHIYCMDPPLEHVPQGSWKCKWCAVCHYCGSSSSRCNTWFENHTKCGSCASQTQCPACCMDYTENDLIIKCFKCERWLHGVCDMIKDVRDAEKCADASYVCILCRPSDTVPPHLRPAAKLPQLKKDSTSTCSEGPTKTNNSNNHFMVDGIYLSEYGVNQIKALTMDLPRKKRKKMPNISDMEAGILAAIESVVAGDDKGQVKDTSKFDMEKEKDAKKRQRNLQKLGIGGFLVRLRGPRFKDDEADNAEAGSQTPEGEKPKRKSQKRKNKNKLVETFPAYLQEAFFGKALMNSKELDLNSIKDTDMDLVPRSDCTIKLSKEEIQDMECAKSKKAGPAGILPKQEKTSDTAKSSCSSSLHPVENIPDILGTIPGDLLDHDLVNTIMNERDAKSQSEADGQQRVGDRSVQFHNTDPAHKDELADFITSQFTLDSGGLPSMDSKDVEDVFKGVFVDESHDPMFQVTANQPLVRPRPPIPTTPSAATAPPVIPSPVAPSAPQSSPTVPRPPAVPQNLASPASFPPPSPYHSEYSNSPQFSPAFSEPPSPWPAPANEDGDQPSYNQRSILKWEADEGLGPNATISAVLYANINHPELKRDYPAWAERSKQIAKIWRGLSAEKRAPYLQKARENRAASRMQKAQQDQDKIITVNQKTRVESQEERQWKQMQALRQQQTLTQEQQNKDPNAGPIHPSILPGPPGMVRPPRMPGDVVQDSMRQPLHVAMSHDQKISPLQSPQMPGNQPQMPAPIGQHHVRPEMAPPNQLFIPRGSALQGKVMRSPVYVTRPPFAPNNSQMASPTENYSSVQSTDDGMGGAELYGQKSGPGMVPSPATPQGQETRQHLRDLLQRQQVKKLEQDQMSPTVVDQHNQGPQRMWPQQADDWQKQGPMDGGNQVRHVVPGSMSPGQANQFRLPYSPGHPRMAGNMQSVKPGEFRMNSIQNQPQAPQDVRARMMLAQQHRPLMPGQVRPTQNFSGKPNSFQAGNRNPLDPYGHLVIQQQPRIQSAGGGIIAAVNSSSSSSMLAQQLGRPLQSHGVSPDNHQSPGKRLPPSMTGGSSSSSHQDTNTFASHMPEHQELPDSVTAELEKLEQEQHNDHNQDVETSELDGLGMDDDELLGMGADFNILEYADPELDEVIGVGKTNILDNLDLEEEDKDDKKDKRKEEAERNKSEGGNRVPKGVKANDSAEASSSSENPPTSNNSGFSSGMEGMPPVMRASQPPPPYPGPPPPYPGRPQLGIRNGCGLNNPPGVGIKNPAAGVRFMGGTARPMFSPLPHSTLLSNSNQHLSLQQRKTLLLQEQPLLLEDLLEQEKREQLRQNSGLIGAAPEEPLLSDFDFERLKADVLSSASLGVGLSPPTTGNMRPQQQQQLPPQVNQDWQMDNNQGGQMPHIEQHVPSIPAPPMAAAPPPMHGTAAANIARLPHLLPPPPNPPEMAQNEQERQMQLQYDQWLFQQNNVLQAHLKCFETEVSKLRKIKKSLNSKLRQLKKNGNELNENDAAELERIGRELPGLQKQLDQARKQSRQHNLLVQDYRNKQQKRQQMMSGMNPSHAGGPPSQSPLGAAASPMHSTPQSPLMSPSPSMQPSPLMQHSPMASPLTPSPGPAAGCMAQTSPRGAMGMNPSAHVMDDTQYSPNPDGTNRGPMQQGGGRMIQMSHMRMGNPGHVNQMMPQGSNVQNVNSPGMVMHRGMNPGMGQMQQHRPPGMEGQMVRMRAVGPQDHMRVNSPMGPRFQRMAMTPEMMMRARAQGNFGGQGQMGMVPAGHYAVSRVPFSSQSPTGSVSLRSPSPMTPIGNLGSPPNQMMMTQSRVSPASSPMRRPSGGGSIGSASPMTERPQSVENPLTPRSGPHTPIGGSVNCGSMEGMHNPQHHMSQMDNQNPHYSPLDGMSNIGSPGPHKMQHYMSGNPADVPVSMNNSGDYNMNPPSVGGGGGGGGNPHIIPFPTFSFFDGPVKMGLKGGNPFSVITEQHAPSTSTEGVNQPPAGSQQGISAASANAHSNVAHPAGGGNSSNQHAPQAQVNGQTEDSSSSAGPIAVKSAPPGGESSANINQPIATSSSENPTTNVNSLPATLPNTTPSIPPALSSSVPEVKPSETTPTAEVKLTNHAEDNHLSSKPVPLDDSASGERNDNNCDSTPLPTQDSSPKPDPGIKEEPKEEKQQSEEANSASNIVDPTPSETEEKDTASEEPLIPTSLSLSSNLNAPSESLAESDSSDQPKSDAQSQSQHISPSLAAQLADISPAEVQSQNALLKQLLQNTGCASQGTPQPTENAGFSLTTCLQPKPSVTTHTSHLSEAATRIPQPPPSARLPLQPTQANSTPVEVKVEIKDDSQSSFPSSLPTVNGPQPSPSPVLGPPLPPDTASMDSRSSADSSILDMGPTKLEKRESTDSLILPMEPVSAADAKKADDELKKAKRRQYQTKRKQAAANNKDASGTPAKKRPRKAGKPDEDYDGFMEGFMAQLRLLPPVTIVEPDLGPSYSINPVYGTGDYSKLNTKGYDIRFGDLVGDFGNYSIKNSTDYYNTKPFGPGTALPLEKPASSHRGFYNQEFAAPRTSLSGHGKLNSGSRTPTPFRETDTPDTIVSCSSPECGGRDSPELYPCLKLVETDEDKKLHLRDSPVIHIACPIPIRPLLAAKLAMKQIDDKENVDSSTSPRPFLRENGNITVTLTLSAAAVDEVRAVLRNLANILSIDTPACQIEKIYAPPDKKLFSFKAKDSSDTVDLQCILNGSAKFCKHCDVLVVNNVIRKNPADLLGLNLPSNEAHEELSFCSANCFLLFSISHGVTNPQLDENKLKLHRQSGEQKDGSVKNLLKPTTQRLDTQSGRDPVSNKMESDEPEKKSWKNIHYKHYTPVNLLPNKYKKPSEKELTEMLYRLGITVVPNKIPDDTRKCVLCHQIGDGVSDGPGRLLNFDVDKWIHLNCALWSEEVYETENGALVNVETTLKQSLTIVCTLCKVPGASVKCFKLRCTSVYHVGCALKDGCVFYKNKSVYCHAHIPKGEKENELASLSAIRRVYVQRDENRQVAVVMHHGDQQHLLRVGSLIFLNVGQLLPHQLQAFHTRHYIYPVGYKIVRFYWSLRKANKRCQYICSIHEVEGKPEFRITAQEEDGNEITVKSSTAQGAWLQVLEAVAKVRESNGCIKVFPKYITGEDLFGLTEPAIVKVLESLPGIETLTDYHFKYGRNPLLELPLAINPSGCARSEPKLRTHFKRPHTQRTGAFRASFPTSVLSSSEAACPYSKQFVHSKSSQYKKMKQEWRNNVYLARSKIQGLGLYAARDIERHTMVIEYIGEIIRNELAELREKRYEAQNRGIYMFRIDDDRVIDATLCGGLARYINHSCNPNCVAETVEVDRDLRIIIFANRRISRGEELAYDYKFEVEDDQHKIPCLCGAPNCQQWMN